IATRAEQIMTASAVRCRRGRQRIVGEGQDRSEVGEARPETLAGGHVRALELTGARSPEPLARILQIPRVEVAHLRSLERDDATQLALLHGPRAARADRHGDLLRQRAPGRLAEAAIERAIDGDQAGVLDV